MIYTTISLNCVSSSYSLKSWKIFRIFFLSSFETFSVFRSYILQNGTNFAVVKSFLSS